MILPLAWWAMGAGLAALAEAQRGKAKDYRPTAALIGRRFRVTNPVTIGQAMDDIRSQIPDDGLFGYVSDHLISTLWAIGVIEVGNRFFIIGMGGE